MSALDTCEQQPCRKRKLGLNLVVVQVIVQDKWKDGARNTLESGGRKIGENKLLSKKKRHALGAAKQPHNSMLHKRSERFTHEHDLHTCWQRT